MGYQDYHDHYPQQQHQQQQQYAGPDPNSASYYGCTGIFAKQLQQSVISSGIKRQRIGATFPKKVSNSDDAS